MRVSLVGIGRPARLVVALVALAVAVGVDDHRRPALRLRGIAGLPIHLGIDPADHGEIALAVVAQPQRVVGILREVEMVGAEAGVDERELLGGGVIDGDLARILDEAGRGSGERIKLGGAQGRIPLAIIRRVLGRARLCGEIDAPILVHHGIVGVDLGVPDLLGAPIGRRREDLVGERRARRVFRILHRHLHHRLGVVDGIEDRKVVGAELRRTIDQAVAVDRRLALVGEREVVEIVLGVRPVAHGDDDVALEPGRPRRRGARQLAGLDAVGPIGERGEMAAVRRQQRGHEAHHAAARRSGLDAPRPGGDRRIEMPERLGNVARGVIADLVAIAAAIGLDRVEPLILGLEVHGDAVAVGAGAGEPALVGNPDHRGPVDRRVILGRRGEIGRDHGGQVQRLARRRRDLRRIDQAVAAHPHPVGRLGKVRHHVAPGLVGHRHLGEPGAELGRLRDHPHAGFRSEPAGDDAADVVVVDLDGGRRGVLLGARAGIGKAAASIKMPSAVPGCFARK